MRTILYTLIILSILLPLSIIYIDQQAEIKYIHTPFESGVIWQEVTPTPEPVPTFHEPVISIHFNIVEEVAPVPTPEPQETIIPIPEPTTLPLLTPTCDNPMSNLHTPYLLDRAEVQTFMLYDTTDQHPYTDSYRCGSYAHEVIDNAWSFGIVARYTIVWGEQLGSGGHAILSFPTLNDGNVFVDATADDFWAYPDSNTKTFYTISMVDPTHHGFAMMHIDGFVTYQEYGK